MTLEELRRKVDELDVDIIKRIAERIRVANDIGREKQRLGRAVVDQGRERQVLDVVARLAENEGVSSRAMVAVYREIVTACRAVQGITVAFQGEAGAYSEEAAFNFFGPAVHTKPLESFDDVFRAVERGEAQYGVVPIENSLEGSIARVLYDLLLESDLKVFGETEVRVIHCLIANQGATLDSIKRVYSHPQALGQSRVFLKHLNVDVVPTYDTAGSVKMIKEQGLIDGAAVASGRAAEIYGMKVLAREIEDNPNNFTRFFVLARQDAPASGHDKTSIVFSVKHRPGSLHEFLRVLSDNGINLTKIESRPTRQKPWEYNFYLDFDGHREEPGPREVLQKLADMAIFIKVLGSYPRAK